MASQCPCCKYEGKVVKHDIYRHSMCPECGNVFMEPKLVKIIQDQYNAAPPAPIIEAVCAIPACKSEGPFILEQGSQYIFCAKCGNVSIPLPVINEIRNQLESNPLKKELHLEPLGTKA